jgi:hypothetical protein
MEVAWSKVVAIRRMLEDFPLLLLHDNACPHTANKTNETLRNFKWETGAMPPLSHYSSWRGTWLVKHNKNITSSFTQKTEKDSIFCNLRLSSISLPREVS